MTYRGQVRNGVVVFEAGAPLAEGTVVDIVPADVAGQAGPADDRDAPTWADVFKDVIGKAEGLPASVGLMLVAGPAARLLFQHGQITAHDADLIARSTVWYAGAIWAFSMLQIINRAYYALHDTWTPLVMSGVNLVLNLVVELPLLWFMGEPAMAVGTLVSFAVQAVVMLWMLDRRVGGLGLRHSAAPVAKMLAATALMGAACWGIRASPLYPAGDGRPAWAGQLLLLAGCGAAVYLVACQALGLDFLRVVRGKRGRA